jgi:hypothetical protein
MIWKRVLPLARFWGLSCLLLLLLASCFASPSLEKVQSPQKSSLPSGVTYCASIQNGISFLRARYDPALHLLNEAPNAAPNTYWLSNDNVLAAFVLLQLGQAEVAQSIQDQLKKYGHENNGLIEAVLGSSVQFPPQSETTRVIATFGAKQVKQEEYNGSGYFEDWDQYANLSFLAALDAFNKGNQPIAWQIYWDTMGKYNGTGFRDKADRESYTTYKLALALYTGMKIQTPIPNKDQILSQLLAMQSPNGGFYTHYQNTNAPAGDTNTETTSLALLALLTAGCP